MESSLIEVMPLADRPERVDQYRRFARARTFGRALHLEDIATGPRAALRAVRRRPAGLSRR